MVLEQATKLSPLPLVRFAALCHDLGKGLTAEKYWPKHRGHEESGVKVIKKLAQRLKIPKEYSELACLGSRYHLHAHKAYELKPSTLLKLFEDFDVFRRPERFSYYLDICEADSRGRTGFEDMTYVQRDYLVNSLSEVLSINVQSIEDKTLTGKAIGDELHRLRIEVLVEYKRCFAAPE